MERSRDWMFQAEGDLEHARLAMDHGFHDWAAFSAQQSAEKAVKAVLNRLGADAWGHSVTDLLDGLSGAVAGPEELMDAARELDKVYITSRYPDALPSGSPRSLYTQTEAERMVVHAARILEFCENYLSRAQS
jgi:HEPN domain-containing protein